MDLLTVKEFAARLRISPRQVWKLHSSGEVPAPIRLGRSVRWSLDEVRAWIAAGAPDRATWEAIKRNSGTTP